MIDHHSPLLRQTTSLPFLPTNLVHCVNQIAKRHEPLRLVLENKAFDLRLTPAVQRTQTTFREPIAIGFAVDDVIGECCVDAASIAEILRPYAAIEQLLDAPDYALLLLEALLGKALIGSATRSVRPTAIRRAASFDDMLLLDVMVGEKVGRPTRIAVDYIFGAWLGDIMPVASTASPLDDLQLPLRVVIAELGVPTADLSALELGDVLLPDRVSPEDDLVRVILSEKIAPLARQDGRELELLEPFKASLRFSPGGFNSMSTSAEPDALEELEVPVSFELHRLTATVGDLRQIGPGHVFVIPPRADGEVDITVHGRPIGRGELIRIGEQMGVRVTKVRNHVG